MPFWGKVIVFFIITFISGCTALLPEIAMYNLWQFIDPQTDLAKVIILIVFWFGGLSLCVLFAMVGLILWVSGIKELDKL